MRPLRRVHLPGATLREMRKETHTMKTTITLSLSVFATIWLLDPEAFNTIAKGFYQIGLWLVPLVTISIIINHHIQKRDNS